MRSNGHKTGDDGGHGPVRRSLLARLAGQLLHVFGGFEASVVITATESGWDAHGQLLASDDERESFTFLRDMDPVFTLRFEDGSTVQVTLTKTGDRQFSAHRVHRTRPPAGQPSRRPVIRSLPIRAQFRATAQQSS
jgi:hypothetical protein